MEENAHLFTMAYGRPDAGGLLLGCLPNMYMYVHIKLLHLGIFQAADEIIVFLSRVFTFAH